MSKYLVISTELHIKVGDEFEANFPDPNDLPACDEWVSKFVQPSDANGGEVQLNSAALFEEEDYRLAKERTEFLRRLARAAEAGTISDGGSGPGTIN